MSGIVYWVSSDGGRTFFGSSAEIIDRMVMALRSEGVRHRVWREEDGGHARVYLVFGQG